MTNVENVILGSLFDLPPRARAFLQTQGACARMRSKESSWTRKGLRPTEGDLCFLVEEEER